MLFTKPQHLSAEQVLATVSEVEDKMSKTTVYNTLGLFIRQGLVREVMVNPGKMFCDSNLARQLTCIMRTRES
ncbi:MAG: transcriptional repressor [Gammaproteobacteria bacterium]|nr:transcriptional repressor [Gammaproteobacteria bacterium]